MVKGGFKQTNFSDLRGHEAEIMFQENIKKLCINAKLGTVSTLLYLTHFCIIEVALKVTKMWLDYVFYALIVYFITLPSFSFFF